MEKQDFLKDPVKHIDIKSFDSTKIIEAMKDMCPASTIISLSDNYFFLSVITSFP